MTLAVLSWGAHRTLINTLESYKTFGISAPEKIIYFQEITNEDKRIADKYGFKYIGSKDNLGIAKAYRKLLSEATEDTFLFLENDWVALESGDTIIKAQELLYAGLVDVVRLRHRRFPGSPLWTLQFKGNEYTRPSHLLDSVHWQEHPEKVFPEIIKVVEFYMTSAKYANWTNNPTIASTEWLRKTIVDKTGGKDIEVDLQQWWEKQEHISVAQHEVGIFTHKRIG